MARDYGIVFNNGCTAKDMAIGHRYYAKIDGGGDFRVKCATGRWNKYGRTYFTVEEDYSGVLYGVVFVKDILTKAIGGTLPKHSISPTEPTEPKEPKEPTELLEAATPKATAISGGAVDKLSATGIEAVSHTVEDSVEKLNQEVNVKEKTMGTTKAKMTMRSFLQTQGVRDTLIDDIMNFRKFYDVGENFKERINAPTDLFIGGGVWEQAITALLAGQHILLEGGKATGKNTLTSNLSFFFGRPQWDISFHSNIDNSYLIGCDTFSGGEVKFREGAVYQCAIAGGFGVLDEINMAKNEAVASLHSILDNRRVIDVPGYDRITLHEATRFIGTMNYGYAGTRELNEALTSRFVVINVPELGMDGLLKLFARKEPEADISVLKYFAKLFEDLRRKASNAEISTASVDLRGFLSALTMIKLGMNPTMALTSNVVNKCFDSMERSVVLDTVGVTVSSSWDAHTVFPTLV